MPRQPAKKRKRKVMKGLPAKSVDRDMFAFASRLLLKMRNASWVDAAQKRELTKALRTVERLPRAKRAENFSIELVGPRCWQADQEVFQWWNVRLEDFSLHVSAGGHVFQPERGCDTFALFSWDTAPGVPSEFWACSCDDRGVEACTYPFANMLSSIDLTEPGYSASVWDNAAKRARVTTSGQKTKASPTETVNRQAVAPSHCCELCGRELTQSPQTGYRREGRSVGARAKARPLSKCGAAQETISDHA